MVDFVENKQILSVKGLYLASGPLKSIHWSDVHCICRHVILVSKVLYPIVSLSRTMFFLRLSDGTMIAMIILTKC